MFTPYFYRFKNEGVKIQGKTTELITQSPASAEQATGANPTTTPTPVPTPVKPEIKITIPENTPKENSNNKPSTDVSPSTSPSDNGNVQPLIQPDVKPASVPIKISNPFDPSKPVKPVIQKPGTTKAK